MVKRGGTKTKIPMKKIEKKSSVAVTFSKRRKGLFSKVSQLCLLSGAQVAVLATNPCSDSFYSFGHPSVDAVVSAFLSGNPPPPLSAREEFRRDDAGICLARKELGLRQWWEEDAVAKSDDLEELTESIASMSCLLKKLKELRSEDEKRILQSNDNVASSPEEKTILQSDDKVAFSPEENKNNNNNDMGLDLKVALNNNNDMGLDPEVALNNNNDMGLDQEVALNNNNDMGLDQEVALNNNNDLGLGQEVALNNNNDMGLDQEVDFFQFLDFDSSEVNEWLLESDLMLADEF